ncbi:hypothetical protein J6590_038156 [Homalodisca vitripennis]|nr:hypothetical protein J6590_038156 [Homalodisca vitripennis]
MQLTRLLLLLWALWPYAPVVVDPHISTVSNNALHTPLEFRYLPSQARGRAWNTSISRPFKSCKRALGRLSKDAPLWILAKPELRINESPKSRTFLNYKFIPFVALVTIMTGGVSTAVLLRRQPEYSARGDHMSGVLVPASNSATRTLKQLKLASNSSQHEISMHQAPADHQRPQPVRTVMCVASAARAARCIASLRELILTRAIIVVSLVQRRITQACAYLVALPTPVYFGDRSQQHHEVDEIVII